MNFPSGTCARNQTPSWQPLICDHSFRPEHRTVGGIKNTGARFEAVTTVDSLDVINGRTGSLSNRGYIVNGFSTVEIDGFRRSTDTVAAFRFGRVAESYAARKTRHFLPDSGSIGCACASKRATDVAKCREIKHLSSARSSPPARQSL